jgi:transcriptional regulator with XRE-family HTH domain
MLNLKKIRVAKGLAQKEVAAHIGVTQTAVSDWERGEREPDFETLVKLADFFGVTVDNILGRDNTPTQPITDDEALEYLDELHKRPEMKTLFQVSKKATKNDIETAIMLIEALKKKSDSDE